MFIKLCAVLFGVGGVLICGMARAEAQSACSLPGPKIDLFFIEASLILQSNRSGEIDAYLCYRGGDLENESLPVATFYWDEFLLDSLGNYYFVGEETTMFLGDRENGLCRNECQVTLSEIDDPDRPIWVISLHHLSSPGPIIELTAHPQFNP